MASQSDEERIDALYEKLRKHHQDVIQKAKARGTEFPKLSEDGNRWLGQDNEIYDPNAPTSWSIKIVMDSLLDESVLAALDVNNKALQLMQDELGLETYFHQMENATPVLEQPPLFHASREGAKRFNTSLASTTRYTLENVDGLSQAERDRFKETRSIPLDDGSPLTEEYSMSREEHKTFFQELQHAYNNLKAKRPILVHCSQGQSRSGIFVLLLIIALHVHGELSLSQEEEKPRTNSTILLRSVEFLAKKRKVLSFSERWHPFIDYFASPDAVLTDLVLNDAPQDKVSLSDDCAFRDFSDQKLLEQPAPTSAGDQEYPPLVDDDEPIIITTKIE